LEKKLQSIFSNQDSSDYNDGWATRAFCSVAILVRLNPENPGAPIGDQEEFNPFKMKYKILLIIVTVLTQLTFPNPNFGQAPTLGTVANFVFFTTTGAVGNTGISRIIGNVGSNNGAITGFGSLNGTVYNGDAVTAQCVIDLNSAYSQLNSSVATFFPGVILGNGQVLDSGVYSIAAATSLNLDLTLDGQGDTSAVFIIKIQGAFSTNPNSRVILINKAAACNVFWKVEGAVSMAAGSTLRGTFIVNNAAFSMATGDTLEGRGLSTTGAIAIDNAYANDVCAFFVLPIELLSFTAVCNKQHAVLNWSTATESNNNYFTVERSAEGIRWQEVGTVEGSGISSLPHTYSLTDMQSGPSNSFYRLKRTDLDGHVKYGTVVAVEKCGGDESENITIFPNPSSGKFSLLFKGDASQVYSTEIFNAQGEKLYESLGLQSKFDLSNKPPGVYFLSIHLYSKTINLKLVVEK